MGGSGEAGQERGSKGETLGGGSGGRQAHGGGSGGGRPTGGVQGGTAAQASTEGEHLTQRGGKQSRGSPGRARKVRERGALTPGGPCTACPPVPNGQSALNQGAEQVRSPSPEKHSLGISKAREQGPGSFDPGCSSWAQRAGGGQCRAPPRQLPVFNVSCRKSTLWMPWGAENPREQACRRQGPWAQATSPCAGALTRSALELRKRRPQGQANAPRGARAATRASVIM